jgi:hypothetical protein
MTGVTGVMLVYLATENVGNKVAGKRYLGLGFESLSTI